MRVAQVKNKGLKSVGCIKMVKRKAVKVGMREEGTLN